MRQTTIINNVVVPRYYHLWEDNIESKGVMEAIGTSVGIGPIIGFDIIDTTKPYLSVTGITNPALSIGSIAPKQDLVKGNTKYLKLSDKSNKSGFVVNAHITPDGILSVDPVTINIESMAIDWTSINNGTSCKVIALIASHTYEEVVDETGSLYPTTSNFRAIDLTAYFTENLLSKPLAAYWASNYGAITFAMSVASGFNRNLDVIVGLYILGDTTYLTDNQWFYNTYGKVFPLVPYNTQWPQYNNIGDRYINKLLENLFFNLPVASKELNWTHIYIETPALDYTGTPFICTDNINAEKTYNLPPGTELSEVEFNTLFEILPGILSRRIYFEVMIPATAEKFQNIIDSTIRLEVESSASNTIPASEVLPILHKSVHRLYQPAQHISYIQCDIFIRAGITLTSNNKFPKIKVSFASL